MKYITTVQDQEFVIEVDQDDAIVVDGERLDVDFQQLTEGGVLSLLMANRSLEALVEERNGHWEVLIGGELYAVHVQDERAYRLSQARGGETAVDGQAVIKSPMPGLILNVLVQPGDPVSAGDKVIILESMKMENELRAPGDGVVLRVAVEKGASVEKDQTLVVIGDPDEELGDGLEGE